jgi:MoaA/NifB/PqqE/SkfB family radical SAM enzyme/SAM-dependent methyltransferase
MDSVFLFREDSMRGDDFFLKMATRPPLTKLHPQVADFLKTYLQGEKAIPFGKHWVINTQFPPWPGRAFDNLVDHFLRDEGRRLYSVTLAVTNRCPFNCWHCYNAGRSPEDIPLAALKQLAARIQDLGAVIVTLTGGEPLLRKDLAEICRGFDDRSCITVGTTGWQLTKKRARELRDSGVFAVGISLDSADRNEHNGMRGRKDAFDIALKGLETAREAGLYPYVVSVGTRDFLERERFMDFMHFVKEAGALEVHLLEACATGRLAGRKDVALTNAGRQLILDYQMEIARCDDLPVLSTFTYLEGKDAFGCGAGLTHIYIDGSGELCPCNLVPLSFGNITREPLEGILERMGRHFARPRPACVGRTLTPHAGNGPFPVPPDVSERICRDHLPQNHTLPRFFRIRKGSLETAGREELAEAYDRVHRSYDDAWVTVAGKAVRDLVGRLGLKGSERVFEAGCGSGYGTALLAERLRNGGSVTAADISAGMLGQARKRIAALGLASVDFILQDAVEALSRTEAIDLVFTTWVLGYIELAPFFKAASHALKPGGRLALVVHRENSPRREFEIFSELVAREPLVLTKRVAFDFPRDGAHLREEMEQAGLEVIDGWEGSAVFLYRSAREVLDHLLESGAGTVFYDAIDAKARDRLTGEFLSILGRRNGRRKTFEVKHDFLACIARKKGP